MLYAVQHLADRGAVDAESVTDSAGSPPVGEPQVDDPAFPPGGEPLRAPVWLVRTVNEWCTYPVTDHPAVCGGR